MGKEMNKLMSKITKYDMTCGLFMSLIIGLILNRQIAVAFLLGLFIAIVNYMVSMFTTIKWLGKKPSRVIIITVLRILFVAICAVPFIYELELMIAYLVGFNLHFIVQGYCIIS